MEGEQTRRHLMQGVMGGLLRGMGDGWSEKEEGLIPLRVLILGQLCVWRSFCLPHMFFIFIDLK